MGLKLAPKPEDIIHDATATPSDVAVGKVFYNNEGRQIGTLDSSDLKLFLEKRYGKTVKVIEGEGETNFHEECLKYLSVFFYPDGRWGSSTLGNYTQDKYKKVSGFVVGVELSNGLQYIVPSTTYSGSNNLEVGIDGLYFIQDTEDVFYYKAYSDTPKYKLYYI